MFPSCRPASGRRGRALPPLAAVTLMLVVSLCLLALSAAAFPYGKSSAVTELTPATFSTFVNTHKPVVVLFYAPWCGHCKNFHPEYERFAASVKGTMRVGAINADQYSNIGQQYGVRGFPTIKYWKMGTKSIASPQDYEGQRTAAALQSFMVSGIAPTQVKTAATTEVLKQAAREAPHKKIGVLFSSKEKVPPLLSVMALSPKLKEFPLYFSGSLVLDKGVALNFNVLQLPTVGILQYTPANATAAENFELVPYAKKAIAYEPIAHFFLECMEQTCSAGETAVMGEGATAAAADEETENAEEGHHRGRHGRERHRAHQHPHRHPSVALPVEPVEFTNKTIEHFCSPRALRLHNRSPLCVVSLTEQVNLKNLHEQFQNDPLLFFDANKHRADVVRQFQEDFNVTLATDVTMDEGAVVVMRQGRPARLRHMLFQNVMSDSDLQRMLQKILNGEVRLGKTFLDAEQADE